MGLKVIITSHPTFFNCSAGMNSRWHPEISEKQPCYLPYGKADGTASPRFHGIFDLRCQGLAVNYYSCTLDALDLQHPRLLQR